MDNRFCPNYCAPYMHPRPQSTEVKGEDGGPLRVEFVKFSQ